MANVELFQYASFTFSICYVKIIITGYIRNFLFNLFKFSIKIYLHTT